MAGGAVFSAIGCVQEERRPAPREVQRLSPDAGEAGMAC